MNGENELAVEMRCDPVEVLFEALFFEVLNHLSMYDFLQAANVNLKWRTLAKKSNAWRLRIWHDFPDDFKLFSARIRGARCSKWKKLYHLLEDITYKGLSDEERRDISLIKQGDFASLRLMDSEQTAMMRITRHYENVGSLVEWAIRFGYNEWLQQIYQCIILPFYSSRTLDSRERTLLHWAVATRQFPVVIGTLIDQGADIYAKDVQGETPLWIAAQIGHIEVVRLLIAKGVKNINQTNRKLYSPLHIAAFHGHLKTVIFLLENGGDPMIEASEGFTPFELACYKGHLMVAAAFIDHCYDLKDSLLRKDLATVCDYGHYDVGLLLLKHGARADPTNESNGIPLIAAAGRGHSRLVRLLLENGADVNRAQAHDDGLDTFTALMVACKEGHLDTTELLIDYKADINLVAKKGMTALAYACVRGHLSIVKLLFKNGAADNVNKLIALACRNANLSLLTFLIELRDKMAVPEQNEFLPLLAASAHGGQLQVVQYLLDNGAPVNQAQDSDGATALMFACQKGYTEVARLLLKHGALVDTQMKSGTNSLLKVCENEHVDLVKLLLEHGAQVNLATDTGYTALLIACMKGNVIIARLLLERGANVSDALPDGTTPLSIARENDHDEMVDLLLEYEGNAIRPYGR